MESVVTGRKKKIRLPSEELCQEETDYLFPSYQLLEIYQTR